MSVSGYTRYELLRTFRNKRLFVFSLGFPLVLYLLIAGPSTGDKNLGGTGIPAPLYFMVGLVAFGTMNAMISSGARIAWERSVGWNRQLRLTPLSPRAYLGTKVITAYVMATVSMAVMFGAGTALGVTLPAKDWLEMIGLLLVGLVPFAALGILVGHLITPDSIGPVIGGGTSLLALLGGTWFPIGTSGVFYEIARCLPSYWLVKASHVSVGGAAWGARGWGVMAAWTVVLSLLAARAYRRDTGRV